MKYFAHWEKIKEHYLSLSKHSLTELFEKNPKRGNEFSIQGLGLYFDYSKNLINQDTLSLFSQLADNMQLKKKAEDLFTGKIVNISEKRAALHTALRDPKNINKIDPDIHSDIFQTQDHMLKMVNDISSGTLKNHQGKSFKHLVCLGIGGSYLGPKVIIDALKPTITEKISIHFVANIDPSALHQTLNKLDINDCLFFIASKSFSTFETITNAQVIKDRFLALGLKQQDIQKHFIAASSNINAAKAFGCHEDNILKLWDFIGGRYSLWSSIGLPIALALGEQRFLELLAGAHDMDQHFIEAPLEKNMPFLLGAIAIWHQNIIGANSRAVIPYDHNLKAFPAFLQQLEMESLGKRVDADGEDLSQTSGAVIWGSEGANSQHAFHQLLHQSDLVIPCDFIVCKESHYDNKQQALLFTQCIAQSRALMLGSKTENNNKRLLGNKTSNTIVLEKLEAKALGSLIALYEHKVFVQASLLNMNPFDQWGVEFGKTTAVELQQSLTKRIKLDSSSDALLNFFKN